MRNKFIAGNWKMFKDMEDVKSFINDIDLKEDNKSAVKIGICPPSIHLSYMSDALQSKGINIYAQNVYFEKEGAFTGEISIPMLKSAKVKGSIVGHSERRNIFGESDELINNKVRALIASEMEAILCIGESLEEREEGKAFDVSSYQLEKGLAGISKDELGLVTIAYEPIWAIGTGKVATPEEAEEMCAFIRNKIEELYDKESADKIIIQYGGSVNDENAMKLLTMPNIDGALVGGASLNWNKFTKIVNFDK